MKKISYKLAVSLFMYGTMSATLIHSLLVLHAAAGLIPLEYEFIPSAIEHSTMSLLLSLAGSFILNVFEHTCKISN